MFFNACFACHVATNLVLFLFWNRNQTFDVEEEEYNNYDITQICSEDSTDDESNPKMPPPLWAEGVYELICFRANCC